MDNHSVVPIFYCQYKYLRLGLSSGRLQFVGRSEHRRFDITVLHIKFSILVCLLYLIVICHDKNFRAGIYGSEHNHFKIAQLSFFFVIRILQSSNLIFDQSCTVVHLILLYQQCTNQNLFIRHVFRPKQLLQGLFCILNVFFQLSQVFFLGSDRCVRSSSRSDIAAFSASGEAIAISVGRFLDVPISPAYTVTPA